jgi:hypothetical protein
MRKKLLRGVSMSSAVAEAKTLVSKALVRAAAVVAGEDD